MLFLFKILFWIWILKTKISQLNFKIANLNVRSNNNFAYCFKCSKNRSFKINKPTDFNFCRSNNYRLSSISDTDQTVKFGNVNSQYLSNLNWELINLNNSIINNTSEQCYKDLEKVFDMISEPVASLYSEPIEVDYNTKLHELNTKFGLNLDKIYPPLILKLNTHGKSKVLDLSYEYLTEQKTDNGEVENKLWKRELKENVPKDLKKQFNKSLNEFSKIMGNFFYKFYDDNVLALDDLLHKATTLGLQATGQLFESLPLLQLKNDCTSENLKKSLDLIIHYSHLDELRCRSYNKIINHFFKNNDPDSILEVLKHYKQYTGKKITSIQITEYLLSLANKYEQDLDELDETYKYSDFFINVRYSDVLHRSKIVDDNFIPASSKQDEKEYKNKRRKLLLECKEKVKEALELYKENYLDPFGITQELADILKEKFDDIVPGLFKVSYVRAKEDVSGSCGVCKSKIKYTDLSENDRYGFVSKILETISLTSPNELVGLFDFYEFLKRSKESGNQYTCIIDGQNIGYSRNHTNVLNWFKLNYSFNFMKSLGENPLIVVPQKGLRYLLTQIKNTDPGSFNTINQMIQNGSIYSTNKNSYDDNYFLLAGMTTFSDKESELFQKILKESNIKVQPKYDFGQTTNFNHNSNVDNNKENKDNKQKENKRVKQEEFEKYGSEEMKEESSNEEDKNKEENERYGSEEMKEENKSKNVIILTNDRLSNLRIEKLDKELFDRWSCYSLVNFNCFGSGGKEIFVLGQRLKYTFDIISDKDRFHIPIGMDRVFSNSFEIHRCSFRLKQFPDECKVFLNLYPTGETPIKNWILKNKKYLYPSYDRRSNQDNEITEQNYINTKKMKKDDKKDTKESDVFHRSPEIARLMFSPSWNSPWLCIDLEAFDRKIQKI